MIVPTQNILPDPSFLLPPPTPPSHSLSHPLSHICSAASSPESSAKSDKWKERWLVSLRQVVELESRREAFMRILKGWQRHKVEGGRHAIKEVDIFDIRMVSKPQAGTQGGKQVGKQACLCSVRTPPGIWL